MGKQHPWNGKADGRKDWKPEATDWYYTTIMVFGVVPERSEPMDGLIRQINKNGSINIGW